MTSKKTTKRALLLSVVSLLLCCSMLIGTTYAWFTDSVASGMNQIVAGNLDIELYYATPSDVDDSGNIPEEAWTKVTADAPVFNKNALWEPGYTEVVYLKAVNLGTLSLRYRMNVRIVDEISGTNKAGKTFNLSDYIQAYAIQAADYQFQPLTSRQMASDPLSLNIGAPDPFSDTLANAVQGNYDGFETGVYDSLSLNLSQWLEPEEEWYTTLVLFMPTSVGNEANYMTGTTPPQINLGLNVLTTQYDWENEKDSFDENYDEKAEYPDLGDVWDGTADTTWYDPENPQTYYVITTAEQLAGIAELVSGDTTFDDVTFVLGNDLDLYCEDTTPAADGDPLTFRPIGDHSKDGTFEGTFDGNGYTISNLYQNGWDLGYEWGVYGSYGLFGNINDATIKNLTITGAESYIEGGDVGGITGSATGTCVFENITIEDSVFATYNNGNGGIIAWSGDGEYTFKNIKIAEDVVLAGLWGSFDSSIGGIVGQAEPGATYNFENVDVACRIDAYNDCTASYDYYNYRMCGMLIGRLEETTTIDGVNYPDTSKYNINCNNVTVTYGDWANYHYCEPTPGLNGGRGMRVEPGYSYNGLPEDFDHTQCTTNHMALIPFDQIFGGDQLGVKGLKSYDGVTVNYVATISTADQMIEALENGKDVILTNDVTAPSDNSNAYGKTALNITAGQTFDGNGNTLSAPESNGTWDSAISITSGTIKNLTIDSGFRGIFVNHNGTGGHVTLENVVIDGPVYTISCDQGTGNGLTAINSVFNGWTSYAATIGEVKFEGCSFGEGAGYAFCRPYAPTEFVGCDFEAGFQLDARAAVTFENCTIGGEPLTAENLATLVTGNIANATVK